MGGGDMAGKYYRDDVSGIVTDEYGNPVNPDQSFGSRPDSAQNAAVNGGLLSYAENKGREFLNNPDAPWNAQSGLMAVMDTVALPAKAIGALPDRIQTVTGAAQRGDYGPATDDAMSVAFSGLPIGAATAPRGAIAMGGGRLPGDFVPSPTGSINFGHVPAPATPLGKPVPIRMFEGLGASDVTPQGWVTPDQLIGRRYLADHPRDMRRADSMVASGSPDEVAFVHSVTSDPSAIYRQNGGVLEVSTSGGRDNMAALSLFPSENGDFYTVGNAMSRSVDKKYPQGGGRELVWSKSPVPASQAPLAPSETAALGGSVQTIEQSLYPRADGSKPYQMYMDYAPQYRSAVEADLPMDAASRMARARDMGYHTNLYHGTGSDISAFQENRRGNWFTDRPEIANIYADKSGPSGSDIRSIHATADQNVMPVMIRGKVLEVSDLGPGGGGWSTDNIAFSLGVKAEDFKPATRMKELSELAKSKGYSAIKITDMNDLGGVQSQWKLIDPTAVRSRFAAFNPAKKDSTDLLASVGGPAGLLGIAASNRDEEKRK
jgi:hypothetical protein